MDLDIEALLEAPFKTTTTPIGPAHNKNGDDSTLTLKTDREDSSKTSSLNGTTMTPSPSVDKQKSSDKYHSRDSSRDGRRREPSSDKSDQDSVSRRHSKHKRRRHASRSRSRDSRRRRHSSRSRRDRSRSPSSRKRRDSSRERHHQRRRERSRSRNGDDSDLERDSAPVLNAYERDKRTVFVKQLAQRLKERELYDFFKRAGKVRDAKIVTDKISRRSKGVGYVEFYDIDSVANALVMTGTKLLGIPVIVELTESEKNRRAEEAEAEAKALKASQAAQRFVRLQVSNLHLSVTEASLKKLFDSFGPVEQVSIQKEPISGITMCETKRFKRHADAKSAMADMNGFELLGKTLAVSSVLDKVSTLPALGSSLNGGLNLDDGDVVGVSLNSASRAELMARLARDNEVVVAPAPKRPVSEPMQKATLLVSTRCVLLTNMFDPAQESGAHWEKEIEEDVKDECSKFGTVSHIAVDKDSAGLVYLKFAEIDGAQKAINALNGRFFAGQKISAKFVSDAVYHVQFPQAARL